jgi:transcription antitermination factor NusG
MTDGVINYVYWNGKPAMVKEKEIETIKKFLNDYENVQAIPTSIVPQQKVRIETGILMNSEGVVQKVLHNKVEVLIESLGYMLVATVDKRNVQPV